MKYFLGFDKIRYFPLWVIAGYYFPQSIYGFFVYDKSYAFDFLIITIVSCFSYIFFFEYVYSERWLRGIVNRPSRWSIDVVNLSYVIFGLYLGLIVYISITADQIALFIVFQGASIGDLAKSREMFLRTREGWEAAIPYINAMFVMALLPYSIASLFFVHHKLRFYFLGIFLFCVLLTLEKSVALMALIPIIILSVNASDRGKNKSFKIIAAVIVLISGVSFLARGGLQDETLVSVRGDSAATIPEDYKLLKCDNQICYIANRVLWIPYATAIDWLRYQDEELDGNYVLGRSIGPIATLLDTTKINLEREVFAFQWGQNETGTGSSNTAYFIDAFVNFSWIGVILYAMILALIVKIIDVSDNCPVKCTIFISLFYLGVNSLPPMLFSGGLIVIIFIALFFKQRTTEVLIAK